jgi:hypothetical protein
MVPKDKYITQGIYLPTTAIKYRQIKKESAIFTSNINIENQQKKIIDANNNVKNPIGIIRIGTHYKNLNEVKQLCQQNIELAKRIGTQFGASLIMGNCLYSNNISYLNRVTLYAYAYL